MSKLVTRLRCLGSRLTGFQIFGIGLWWDPGRPSSSSSEVVEPEPLAAEARHEAQQPLEKCHAEVLLAIARSREGWLDIEQVARRIRVGKLVAEHYLEFLESLEMVEDVDETGVFELTAEGRAYLVEEALVR